MYIVHIGSRGKPSLRNSESTATGRGIHHPTRSARPRKRRRSLWSPAANRHRGGFARSKWWDAGSPEDDRRGLPSGLGFSRGLKSKGPWLDTNKLPTKKRTRSCHLAMVWWDPDVNIVRHPRTPSTLHRTPSSIARRPGQRNAWCRRLGKKRRWRCRSR